jgi:hypothetical protein
VPARTLASKGQGHPQQVPLLDLMPSRLSHFAPVLGGDGAGKDSRTLLALESLKNQMPGAIGLPIDFAAPLLQPSAGAVEQTFGAVRYRTDPCGFVENALSAKRAFFLIVPEATDVAEKERVESADDPLVGAGRDRLHPGPAGENEQSVGLGDLDLMMSKIPSGAENMARFVYDDPPGDLPSRRLEPLLRAENLLFAPRLAGRGAGAATDQKDPGFPLEGLQKLVVIFPGTDDHKNPGYGLWAIGNGL